MASKQRVFVASSSEQKKVADEVAAALKSPKDWTVQVWDQTFDFSASYIESLERELERADFAVVVLTGDDVATVRRQAAVLPRDNVIFELGLFIGRLGRERCFFFIDGGSQTQIASDLSGVKPVAFFPPGAAADPLRPTLQDQAQRVKEQMRALPLRCKPSARDREEQARLWRFSSQLAGFWWERMKRDHGGLAALSYVEITVDAATHLPCLNGKAFAADGMLLARWKSVTMGVALGRRPRVEYGWLGSNEGNVGQIFGGLGTFEFDDERLRVGEGHFLVANFADIRSDQAGSTLAKEFRLHRCARQDAQIMKQMTSPEALQLRLTRLQDLAWG